MQTTSILVGYDGTATGNQAVREAADIARRTGARLTVLRAVTDPNVAAFSSPYATGITPDELRREIHAEAERETRAVVDGLPRDLGVRWSVVHGRPSTALLEAAERDGHDLIVVGACRHHFPHHALHGSTASALMTHGRTPVLVVSPEGADAVAA